MPNDIPQPRPWLSEYPPGVPDRIEEPRRSLTRLLDEAVSRFGPRVALDYFGATTTYRELGRQVASAAAALRRLGVARDDRVAVVLPNCPQHVVAFYAVLRLGAVVVEHNPLSTADEHARQLADHGAETVICWEKAVGAVLRAAVPAVRTVIAVDLAAALPLHKRFALRLPLPAARRQRAEIHGTGRGGVLRRPEMPTGVLRWEALIAHEPPLQAAVPHPDVTDAALLLYTGGTTGTPKGVVLTHRNLAANMAQGRAWIPGLHEGGETFLAVLPLFHAFGLTLCLTFAVSIGARLVLLPRFDVAQVLAAVRRTAPSFLPGVPPMYERLADAAERRGVSLRSVRYGISGAMSLPPQTVHRWERLTGGLLVEGYGMTETSPVTLGNPVSPARRPGTVGVPFPSTLVRIVDPDEPSRERPIGEPGELLVQGPQVFSGYWSRPEETAATLLPGGWVRSGDIAVMDADGFVTIVDRIKELIITGGFNVYPSEVEEVLRGHPEIADAAVVGIPGGTGGEDVVAAVVPSGTAELDTEAVRRWCRERLAGYKVPRRVATVAELPRNQIGKVLRRTLREDVVAGRQPALR